MHCSRMVYRITEAIRRAVQHAECAATRACVFGQRAEQPRKCALRTDAAECGLTVGLASSPRAPARHSTRSRLMMHNCETRRGPGDGEEGCSVTVTVATVEGATVRTVATVWRWIVANGPLGAAVRGLCRQVRERQQQTLSDQTRSTCVAPQIA